MMLASSLWGSKTPIRFLTCASVTCADALRPLSFYRVLFTECWPPRRGPRRKRNHAGTRVLVLIADLDVRILTEEGELLRALRLNPSRDYQSQPKP